LLKKTKIKHILTHQRLNVVFWHYNVNELEKNKKYKTIEIKKIDQYPVPKIVENYIAENLRIDLI
jgi:adenine-specific DNA glycosylase